MQMVGLDFKHLQAAGVNRSRKQIFKFAGQREFCRESLKWRFPTGWPGWQGLHSISIRSAACSARTAENPPAEIREWHACRAATSSPRIPGSRPGGASKSGAIQTPTSPNRCHRPAWAAGIASTGSTVAVTFSFPAAFRGQRKIERAVGLWFENRGNGAHALSLALLPLVVHKIRRASHCEHLVNGAISAGDLQCVTQESATGFD